jgi:RND family efflux transporter MFP subunit
MRRIHTAILTLTVLSVLSACSTNHKTEAEKAQMGPATRVKVEVASTRQEKQMYKASGTVRSVISAPLASKMMGTVLEVRVKAGDRVKAGQVLAVIDSRETEAMVNKSEAGMQEAQMGLQEIEKNLEAAQANLQLATSTLKRFQELADQKSVSPQEFDEVENRQRAATAAYEALQARKNQVLARIQQAQSDVKNSQAIRSYAEIRSPLGGVVVQRQVEPGSLAVPGVPLLIVEDLGPYRLEVPIEESQIAQIKLGTTVDVIVSAIGSSKLEGRVAEIQPSADPSTRTYLVKVNLPSVAELRSGMYGEAHFPSGVKQGLWLPKKSVVSQGQLEDVYVVEHGNTARLRLLKLGETTPETVEILAGLENGETYVVDGGLQLQDGVRVEVVR